MMKTFNNRKNRLENEDLVGRGFLGYSFFQTPPRVTGIELISDQACNKWNIRVLMDNLLVT